MRIPVYIIVSLVAAGESVAEILDDYPYLEPEDVSQALQFAALLTREELHARV